MVSTMNVTERVRAILRASHAARNYDKELWLIYAQKSGMQLSEAQISVYKSMPSSETIRRTRQKLQMDGLYPADPEVDEARYKKYVHTKYNIVDDDPEKLLEAQGIKVLPWGQ